MANKQEANDIMNRLNDGIKEVFESDNFKKYIRTMSKFHNYSIRNILLIFSQRPDATRIAGYKTWNELNRQVKKGESGIAIVAQCRKKEKDKDGKAIIDPFTGEVDEKIYYKAVNVFDISQTVGDPLSEKEYINELKGCVDNYEMKIKLLESLSKCPVKYDNLDGFPDNCNGYFNRDLSEIYIREDMSEEQTAKTLIHEIACSRLHEDLNKQPDRRLRELESEGVAFAIADYLGIDSSAYSFGYMAGWVKNLKPEEMKQSLETIRAAYQEIITEIDVFMEKEMQGEYEAEEEYF